MTDVSRDDVPEKEPEPTTQHLTRDRLREHPKPTLEDGTEIEIREGSPSSGMSVEIETSSDEERTQEPGLVRAPQPGSKSSDFERIR